MANFRFGMPLIAGRSLPQAQSPLQIIGFRLETIENGQWVWAANVEATMHVMQVILDRLAPLEGVRAVQPNGTIMLPGQGF